MAEQTHREREFDRLKVRLEEFHRGLRQRVGRIADELRDNQQEDQAIEFEERAQLAEDDEVMEALDERGRTELVRTEAALQRMGAGDYGVCVECEGEIQLARLKAIPWATHCIECARARNE